MLHFCFLTIFIIIYADLIFMYSFKEKKYQVYNSDISFYIGYICLLGLPVILISLGVKIILLKFH